jgi:Zn2+/Cd2+-exporting ATPase
METNDSKHTTIHLVVEGLDCPDCAASLERAVQSLAEVRSAHLAFASSRLTLVAETERAVPEVARLAASMGYEVIPEGAPPVLAHDGWWAWIVRRRRLIATGVGGGLLLLAVVLSLLELPGAVSNALYTASIVVGGIFVARAGWAGIRTTRAPDMNALMTVAAVGAMAIGEFAEAAVTVFLFSVGELLESYSMDRARNAIRTLMDLTPEEATLLEGAEERRVPASALAPGDRVMVRPGERIPMDGRVQEGSSAVNQAPITGESMPVEKGVGDEVLAGTINGSGALVMEVTRRAEDTTLARILRLVEEAQSQRAPAQRFVDRFARVYTPAVIGLAALVAAVPPLLGLGAPSTWFYRALVLLVIACPCALVISTPVTIVSALARAARSGVLIKGGRYLEAMASLRAVAFDKTGTLTQGEPHVVNAGCERLPEGGRCESCTDLLAKAAAVEGRSEHALARAVRQYAEREGVSERYRVAEGVRAMTGLGIAGVVSGHVVSVGSVALCRRNDGADGGGESDLCRIATEEERKGYTVLVVEDTCCGSRCFLSVSDALRDGAADVIQDLRRTGIERMVMLTGDNPHIARTIGEEAGVDDVRAGLLPDGKVAAVQDLMGRYGQVAMVGDGVNDAPALAAATVGIAMGAAGTDTALETADVALMADDLTKLPFAIRLSRRALNTVRGNIAFALVFKAALLGLAVAGVATLWMAVLADMGASLLVALNGLRLLRMREAHT